MHPENLYVNLGGFGREDSYKSTDGGHFWSRPSPQQISIGFIDPNNTNLLYGSYIGLSENYKSTDGGNSWISLTGTSDLRVIDAYDPRPPTRLYAGSDSVRINISTDGGTSWFASTNGLPQNDARGAGVVAMNPSNPDELLAATFRSSTAHADYFRTTD